MLGVTNVEVYNSVFELTKQLNSFANYTLWHWEEPGTFENLDNKMEQRKLKEINPFKDEF